MAMKRKIYDEGLIHAGLLLIRVGLGVMFMIHGAPKMIGGPEVWEKVGGAMSSIGINFVPVFWGFMAAFAELVGGFLLLLGLFHRIACFLLLITMVVVTIKHYVAGEGFVAYSHGAEAAIVFLGLLLTGPGKYSIDYRLSYQKPRY